MTGPKAKRFSQSMSRKTEMNVDAGVSPFSSGKLRARACANAAATMTWPTIFASRRGRGCAACGS